MFSLIGMNTDLCSRLSFLQNTSIGLRNIKQLRNFQTEMSSFSPPVCLCISLIALHTLRAGGKKWSSKVNFSPTNSRTALVTSRAVMTVESNAECWYPISLCGCWRHVVVGTHLFHVQGVTHHTISEPEKKQYTTFTDRRSPLWYCWKVIYVWFETVAKRQVCLGIKKNNVSFKWHVGLMGCSAQNIGVRVTVNLTWCSQAFLWAENLCSF